MGKRKKFGWLCVILSILLFVQNPLYTFASSPDAQGQQGVRDSLQDASLSEGASDSEAAFGSVRTPEIEEVPASEDVPGSQESSNLEKIPGSGEAPAPEKTPGSEDLPTPEETFGSQKSPGTGETPDSEEGTNSWEVPDSENAPDSQDTPVSENAPDSQDTPISENAPDSQDTPNSQESPVIEEVPAPGETSPIIEEATPDVEEAPVSGNLMDSPLFKDSSGARRDTVLILDCSGSMSGTPLYEMKQAALKFCQGLLKSSSPGRVAIVTFSTNATLAAPFTDDINTLTRIIDGLYSSGGTNTTAAMEKAYALFRDSDAVTRNLVLMTDGNSQNGKTSANGPYTSGAHYTYANALYQAVTAMHGDCNVYTLGFYHKLGSNDRAFLSRVLSDIQNAGYYDIKDADDLDFAFGDVSEDILYGYTEEQRQFIKNHQEFLQKLNYGKFQRYNDAAGHMLQRYGSNFQNFLGWSLLTGHLSDNPYDIVLADLILSKDNADAQLQAIKADFWNTMPTVVSSFMTFLEGEVPLDAETRNTLQLFLMYEDKSDTNAYRTLDSLLKNKVSPNSLNRFLNMIADAQTVSTFISRGTSIVNSLINILNYSATVTAYAKATGEFRQVLILAAYYCGDSLLQNTIIDYCSITEDDVNDKIRDRILQQGGSQAIGICKDILEGSITGTVQNFLLKNLNLSQTGSAAAGQVLAFIEGCRIGFEFGKLFCNLFLNLDNAADTFLIAYGSAKMAELLKNAADDCLGYFQKNGDLKSAKLFCQAFLLYKKAQINTVDRTIAYVEAIATAFFSNYNGYVAEMSQWLVYKAQWSGLDCKSPESVNGYYKDYRKTYIRIARPTDVEVSDSSGRTVVQIADNTVISCQNSSAAVVSNQVKYLLLPSVESYHIRILSTGEGSMDYSISKLQADLKVENGVVCKDIPLQTGASFEGNIQPANSAEEDSRLTSAGEEVKSQVTVVDGQVLNKITLDSSGISLYKGKTRRLQVRFHPANLSEKVTWKSSAPGTVSVSDSGVVKGLKKGSATITAASESGSAASCKVTVKEVAAKGLKLSKSALTLYKNKTFLLKAQLSPANSTAAVKWISSNKKVAAVSAKGTVKAVGKGTATITASTGKLKASCKITVKEIPVKKVTLNRTKASVYRGKSLSLKASLNPASSTEKVTWKTSDPKTASVSSSGAVTGVRKGTAVITATAGGKKASCKVTVKEIPAQKLAVSPSALTLEKGKSTRLKSAVLPKNTTDSLAWSTSDKKVAAVSKNGTVKAVSPGTATITLKSTSGKKAVCKVTVQDTSIRRIILDSSQLNLNRGDKKKLTAQTTPAKSAQKLKWKSSDTSVATVDENGTVLAAGQGTATVTAYTTSVIKAECKVTVSVPVERLELSKSSLKIVEGLKYQLGVKVCPSSASDQKVQWSSSSREIAVVSGNGMIKAKQPGTTTITASSKNGCTASCTVTVAPYKVDPESIALDKTSISLMTGDSQTLTATVSPSEAGDSTVTWSSSAPSVAQVNSKGTVTALSPGTAVITAATLNGKTASCTCTVTGGFSIRTEEAGYTCRLGDILTVKASLSLDKAIELNQKQYILYFAYLKNFRWEEIGGFDIDGASYFRERWLCTAKVTDYSIRGNTAEVTLQFPTEGLEPGKRTFSLALFPYDKYSTGNSICDCIFRVTLTDKNALSNTVN